MKRHLTYNLLSVLPALLCAVAFAAVRVLFPSSLAVAIAAAVACAVLACLALLLHKHFAPTVTDSSAAVTCVSSLLGFLLLACFAFSVYYRYFAPLAERIAVINGAVTLLTSIFALLAAAYFLLSALAPSMLANKTARLLWAIAPILYCAFRILNDFIATGTMPLANGGGYHILGMIATMLFLLCEGKLLAKGGKTFSYLACGQIALVLNAAYNIPLIAFFAEASVLDLLHGVLFLAFSLYIAVRLLTLSGAAQETETQA